MHILYKVFGTNLTLLATLQPPMLIFFVIKCQQIAKNSKSHMKLNKQ